jgi:phosphatidylglycerophosphate synthase
MSDNRRPVKSRTVQLFHRLAFFLVNAGLTPNQVSVLSSVFATLGAASLLGAAHAGTMTAKILLLAGALAGIQGRLICNLIDGLMAVEGGKKTPYGEFFNDFPDRVSDVVLILSAGYAASMAGQEFAVTVAWTGALLAVLTAYIRVLGAAMGAPHFFLGPMAKQHRMAVLNAAIVATAVEALILGSAYSLTAAVWIIALGSLVTCVRRARAIISHFKTGVK